MTKTQWRLLELDVDSYAEATMSLSPAIARACEEEKVPETLAMFTHRQPSIVMGRQNDPEVDVKHEYCRDHGIIVKRVPTPGTIFGHSGYVMNVLFIRRERVPEAIPDVFAFLNTRVAETFTRKLGLKARHRPINDLEVEIEGVWKKIGPFGISFFGPFICCRMGLTIRPMPFDVVEQAVPGPAEKFADKAAKSVTARVGCLNEALGREASVDEVQALLRDAFTDLFGVELRAGSLTDTERGYDDALRALYDNDEWFWANSVKRRFPQIPTGASLSEHTEKIPNGPLVRARVLQRRDEILDVSLTGWYHGVRPLDALEKVESTLKGVPRNEHDITQRIETAYREHDLEIGHCGAADLASKVWTAASKETG